MKCLWATDKSLILFSFSIFSFSLLLRLWAAEVDRIHVLTKQAAHLTFATLIRGAAVRKMGRETVQSLLLLLFDFAENRKGFYCCCGTAERTVEGCCCLRDITQLKISISIMQSEVEGSVPFSKVLWQLLKALFFTKCSASQPVTHLSYSTDTKQWFVLLQQHHHQPLETGKIVPAGSEHLYPFGVKFPI